MMGFVCFIAARQTNISYLPNQHVAQSCSMLMRPRRLSVPFGAVVILCRQTVCALRRGRSHDE
jgi:hypothetical protein